jgi:hypothetical protein
VSALGERQCPLLPLCVLGKKSWVVNFHHTGTGARGYHDVIECFEGGDDLSGNSLCGARIATIIGGLAAAGLRPRDDDVAARLLEQLHRREPGIGAKQIDEAGNQQADYPLRPNLHVRPQRIGDKLLRAAELVMRGSSFAERLWPFSTLYTLYATGSTVTGSSFQMSRLYSRMVRSVENQPL